MQCRRFMIIFRTASALLTENSPKLLLVEKSKIKISIPYGSADIFEIQNNLSILRLYKKGKKEMLQLLYFRPALNATILFEIKFTFCIIYRVPTTRHKLLVIYLKFQKSAKRKYTLPNNH